MTGTPSGRHNPNDPDAGIFDNMPGTLGDIANKQGAFSQSAQCSSTGSTEESAGSKPAAAEVKIVEEMGFCMGCNDKMTKAQHNEHVCLEP